MEFELKDKVAIVTGASQGIGRAIVRTFAAEGASVVIVDLNEEKGGKLASEINESGGKALFVRANVMSYDDTQRLFEQTVDAFKGVDILVNNAAAARVFGELWEVDRDVWLDTINVNLLGTMNCTRSVIEHMVGKQYGRIVNVTSDAARVGEPRCAWYSASKAGVMGFTKGLARDVGKYGITANIVSPGFTMHERYEEINQRIISERGQEGLREREEKILRQYPLRKFGRPEDIADTVVFLSSSRAGHLTGQTVSVSGGYTMI